MIIPKKEDLSEVHFIEVDAKSEKEPIINIHDFDMFMLLLKISPNRTLMKTKILYDTYQFKDINQNVIMYCSLKECLRIVGTLTDKYNMHDIYRLQLVE